MAPTNQHVGATCDTIIEKAENPILEKLCFRIINPLQLSPDLKTRLLGIPEEAFDFGLLSKSGDFVIVDSTP